MTTPDMLALGRKVMAAQPFSVLLGAELAHLVEGQAEIRFPMRDEFRQQFGFAHGGLIAYAADNAIAFAGGSVLGTNVALAGFYIAFLRPARGSAFIARGMVVHRHEDRAECQCQVFSVEDGEECLCAVALGTVRTIRPRKEPDE